MKTLIRYKVPFLGEYQIAKRTLNKELKFKKFLGFNNSKMIVNENTIDEVKKELSEHAAKKYKDKYEQVMNKLEKVQLSIDFSPDNWLDEWKIKIP